MNIITTPKQYRIARVDDVFVRLCRQCDGSGEYSFNHLTGDTYCYRCLGRGYTGKAFATVEDAEKACIAYEKAAERREAKREADRLAKWEAGAEARAAQEAQREAHLAELASWKHLEAAPGQTVTVTGSISKLHTFQNNFGGYSTIVVIDTPDKEQVKMFTSAGWVYDVNLGDIVTVTGTVSEFGEYEGRAQTTIKSPKRVS